MGRPKYVLTDEEIKKINERYADTLNMAQVAREFNIPATIVKKNLTEENLGLKGKQNDDRDALFFYILKLFGQYSETNPVSPWNMTQMQKFKSQGISYKAQLLTLKYFYEVKNNSIEKSRGSIGIIPYIVADSELYYKKQAKKAEEFAMAIKTQLEKDRIEIKVDPNNYFKSKRKKKLINLNEIGE